VMPLDRMPSISLGIIVHVGTGYDVAGLAGFGKTMLVAHLLGQLAPSPAVQFVLIDGKGGPDYDRLMPRAWLSAKDDLNQVRDVLRQVHRLMLDRQAAIASVLGGTDAWHLGPSPSWPLVVVIIDEAHTFFHERKGTSPEVKAHNALVAELSRLVEELIRKGRNVAIQVMLLTQRATGDAIPTRIRDNCQVAISFANPHRRRRRGRAGRGDPPAPRHLPRPAQRPGLCRGGGHQPAGPSWLPPGPHPPGGPTAGYQPPHPVHWPAPTPWPVWMGGRVTEHPGTDRLAVG
jgi:DNA segregation ATPase FtsK/SpoIIIE, S-DNA-T family